MEGRERNAREKEVGSEEVDKKGESEVYKGEERRVGRYGGRMGRRGVEGKQGVGRVKRKNRRTEKRKERRDKHGSNERLEKEGGL